MPRLLHTLLVLVWARQQLHYTKAAQKEIAGLNGKEYKALCSIYNTGWSFLTTQDPTKRFAGSNDAVQQAQQRIDAFLVLANETDAGYEALKDQNWKLRHPRPTNKELLSYLNASMEALRQRTDAISEQIRQTEQVRTEKLEKARAAIFRALFRTDADKAKRRKILDGTADSADLAIAFASAGTYAAMCKDGAEVGKSLIQDIVCICSENSAKAADKSCTAAGTTMAGHNLQQGGQGETKRWLALRAGCEKKGKELQPTSANSAAALHNGISRVHQLLGANAFNLAAATDEAYPQSVMTILGGTNGGATASASCDGSSVDPEAGGTAHGICVDYKAHAGEEHLIPWAEELHKATAAIQEMEQAERKLTALATTLTSLAENMETTYLHASVRQTTPAATQAGTETDQIDKKEKQCNQAGQSKSECDNLKDKGCVFDDTAKKCELKKEVKEKLEKANQETEGKDGKTTNTTGSNSFVIHKAPLLLAFLLF